MVVMVPSVTMIMPVTMAVAASRVGPAFWIERRLDRHHPSAETRHHRLDHVIAPDAQPFAHELHRQVAVAEVPGNADRRRGIGAGDLGQGFGRSHDLDQVACVEQERVAASQRHSLGQIEQEGRAADAAHADAAPVPLVEVEHHHVMGLSLPRAGGSNRCRAHGQNRK